MDWVLLGALTVAILTGAALILLLVEPDVPVRNRVASGGSDPVDEAAVPAEMHELADTTGEAIPRDQHDLTAWRAGLRELAELLASFEVLDIDRLLDPWVQRSPSAR